jgi:hypothetical protein
MQLSSAREDTAGIASRWYLSILCKPKVHYLVRKSSPSVPTLIQTNPIHTTPSFVYKIRLNAIHHVRILKIQKTCPDFLVQRKNTDIHSFSVQWFWLGHSTGRTFKKVSNIEETASVV